MSDAILSESGNGQSSFSLDKVWTSMARKDNSPASELANDMAVSGVRPISSFNRIGSISSAVAFALSASMAVRFPSLSDLCKPRKPDTGEGEIMAASTGSLPLGEREPRLRGNGLWRFRLGDDVDEPELGPTPAPNARGDASGLKLSPTAGSRCGSPGTIVFSLSADKTE
jgi:hypothetical protein